MHPIYNLFFLAHLSHDRFFSFRTLASGAAVASARQHKKLVRRGDQLGWLGGFTMGVGS